MGDEFQPCLLRLIQRQRFLGENDGLGILTNGLPGNLEGRGHHLGITVADWRQVQVIRAAEAAPNRRSERGGSILAAAIASHSMQ